ncbi:NAD(P)/FAD-dependent oxidoreductase, partial [Candidatus Zixiibacteriota bacterium]
SAGVHFIFESELEMISADCSTASLRAPDLEILADHIVLAAGAWTGELTASLKMPLPVIPVRGQAALVHAGEVCPPCVIFSPDGYVVPRAGGEIFAGSTVEYVGFNRNTTNEGIDQIWRAARWMLPGLAERKPEQSWAGLRPGTEDGMPIVGPLPGYGNLWIATGHFQNGILLAPVTARVIREWVVTGEPGRDMSIFLPDRFL